MFNNYWDWSFPYFIKDISNFFNTAFQTCWDSYNLGQPSTYLSSYYLNLVISKLSALPFIKSEFVLLLIMSALFILTFVVGVGIFGRHNIIYVGLIIFNPAIYYKLLAGHFSYYFSYLIFVYLVFFLKKKYKPDLLNSIKLGLILAFIGVQIQFHVIAFITLTVFLIINKDKFSLKNLTISYLIAFLINLPWLSNFLTGANTVSAISSHAGSESFQGSLFSSPIRIAAMAFSPSTNITLIYDKPLLIFFGLLTAIIALLMMLYLSRRYLKGKHNNSGDDKFILFSIAMWFTLAILSTGFFHKVQIPLVSTFYSMFREISHFAPLVLFFQFTSCVLIIEKAQWRIKWGLVFLLVLFIGLNIYYFARYSPTIDFEIARQELLPFRNFASQDKTTYRVLTYPFWGQYRMLNQEAKAKNNKYISNTGWDSFIGFSGLEYIGNYQSGTKSIDSSLQYRLQKNLSLSELEERNVKYIYDLSSVYTSEWDKYTTPDKYNNDLSVIKNNSSFLKKLIQSNPSGISEAGPNIYKLHNTMPRLSIRSDDASNAISELIFLKISPVEYKLKIKNVRPGDRLIFLNSFHRDWKVYQGKKSDYDCDNKTVSFNVSECIKSNGKSDHNLFDYIWEKPLVSEEYHHKYSEYANSWDLTPISSTSKSSEQVEDIDLMLIFKPEIPFRISRIISFTALLISMISILYLSLRKKHVPNKQ